MLPIENIYALAADEMREVNLVIRRRLSSEVALINELSNYIIAGGGKRLRPLVLLLAARAAGYTGTHHITLAAVIEFIHTATLLHDDVVDGSELRRGRKTANYLWGNEASVLVGDFLYSRSFQMMVEIQNQRVMEILANTTNVIAEGEVMQLLHCHDPETCEESYLEVIRCKTAKLFEAAGALAAVLAGTPEHETDLGEYGLHLGIAFQLIDDVLDYSASAAEMGKNVGDDLEEGKPTLPLIYTLRHGAPHYAGIVREAILTGGREHLPEVLEAIAASGAISYTKDVARDEATKAQAALARLKPSRYQEALFSLVEFALHRHS